MPNVVLTFTKTLCKFYMALGVITSPSAFANQTELFWPIFPTESTSSVAEPSQPEPQPVTHTKPLPVTHSSDKVSVEPPSMAWIQIDKTRLYFKHNQWQ